MIAHIVFHCHYPNTHRPGNPPSLEGSPLLNLPEDAPPRTMTLNDNGEESLKIPLLQAHLFEGLLGMTYPQKPGIVNG